MVFMNDEALVRTGEDGVRAVCGCNTGNMKTSADARRAEACWTSLAPHEI